MGTTIPSDVNTTNLDAGGDSVPAVRADLLDLAQKFNDFKTNIIGSVALLDIGANLSVTSKGVGNNDELDASGGLILKAAQATTSGTEKNFTGISSAAKLIIPVFNDVSFATTLGNLQVRIGDSGGYEDVGYLSRVAALAATDGFTIPLASVNDQVAGFMALANISGNTWVMGAFGRSRQSVTPFSGGGTKTLTGGPLDRVQFRMTAGTFDGGSVTLLVFA